MTSSPPDRTLHCYRHDQAYVGRCDGCVTGDTPVLNQRPESYSTKRPAVTSDAGMKAADKLAAEKPKLSVEQVHAQLRRRAAECPVEVRILIGQLPSLDVVEECARAAYEATNNGQRWADIGGENFKRLRRLEASTTIRRYLELRGLPADTDLEEK